MLSVTGIRKFSSKNMVKNIKKAKLLPNLTLKWNIESKGGNVAIAAPKMILLMYDRKAHTRTDTYQNKQYNQNNLNVVNLMLDITHFMMDISVWKY